MKIGETYWFVSENDQVEQGRLISGVDGTTVCYLVLSVRWKRTRASDGSARALGTIHFGNCNEVYYSLSEASIGLEYLLKRKVFEFTKSLFGNDVTLIVESDCIVVSVLVPQVSSCEKLVELNRQWHDFDTSGIATDFRLNINNIPLTRFSNASHMQGILLRKSQ